MHWITPLRNHAWHFIKIFFGIFRFNRYVFDSFWKQVIWHYNWIHSCWWSNKRLRVRVTALWTQQQYWWKQPMIHHKNAVKWIKLVMLSKCAATVKHIFTQVCVILFSETGLLLNKKNKKNSSYKKGQQRNSCRAWMLPNPNGGHSWPEKLQFNMRMPCVFWSVKVRGQVLSYLEQLSGACPVPRLGTAAWWSTYPQCGNSDLREKWEPGLRRFCFPHFLLSAEGWENSLETNTVYVRNTYTCRWDVSLHLNTWETGLGTLMLNLSRKPFFCTLTVPKNFNQTEMNTTKYT